ncbi:MAG TPA: hypothetical protein VID28_07980 [Methylomirabilota bacterium]|jgi:hypothetical protein
MRTAASGSLMVFGVALLLGACASSEEWAEWRAHTTHFASGQHATFSLRNNNDGSNPRVSRADVDAARTETWWGKAITVNPDQIFQN